MFDKKNKIEITADHHSILSIVWHHVVNDWPQAILVAAIVTIMHSHPKAFGWLHAIDRSVYVVMGHLSARVIPPSQHSDPQAIPLPEVLVIGIGPKTHEERYLERAPLNRCQIKRDLERLYSSQPRLIVVDLDLSPVREPKNDIGVEANYGWGDTTACQVKLDNLVKERAKTIKTVFMAPIAEKRTPEQEKWICVMEEAGVYFASGKLPVEYGVVLSYYSTPGTLSHTAAALWNCKGSCNKCNEEPCDSQSRIVRPYEHLKSHPDPIDLSESHKKILNFQVYRSIGADKLIDISELSVLDLGGKAIFFGAAYGEDDYFLTPIDEIYGVALHAAAFITTFNNIVEHDVFQKNLLHFIVDVVFGLMLGVVISFCWHRYFVARLDTSSIENQLRAPFWIVILFATVILTLFIFSALSLWFLSKHGIWASPVPIAIGMLFESFVSGSVTQAIRVNRGLGLRNQAARIKTDSVELADAVAGQMPDCLSGENQNPYQSFKKFAYLDFKCLWAKKQREAAFLIVSRRLIWLVFVVAAFFSMLPHP